MSFREYYKLSVLANKKAENSKKVMESRYCPQGGVPKVSFWHPDVAAVFA